MPQSRIKQTNKRTEDSLRNFCGNLNTTLVPALNIYDASIIRVSKAEEREKGPKQKFKYTSTEIFHSMGKETITQVHKVQRVLNRINTRRKMPRYILIKLTNIKYNEKVLKATRGKQQITHKGNPIRLSADFLAKILQARREWQDTFKVRKGKILQTRILQPVRLSFRFEGDIKSFTDKQKLR